MPKHKIQVKTSGKNDIWRQTQLKDVQQKGSSHRHSINVAGLRTEALMLHVLTKMSLKSRQMLFTELKILFVSYLQPV